MTRYLIMIISYVNNSIQTLKIDRICSLWMIFYNKKKSYFLSNLNWLLTFKNLFHHYSTLIKRKTLFICLSLIRFFSFIEKFVSLHHPTLYDSWSEQTKKKKFRFLFMIFSCSLFFLAYVDSCKCYYSKNCHAYSYTSFL